MSLAPHTLRESLHNFVILLRLSYLFYFFLFTTSRIVHFLFKKENEKTLEFEPRIESRP